MKRMKKASGFTLIEMLVVIGILVILTSMVLPKLDRVILKSNKAVAGNTAAEVSRYVQTYRIQHNYYPDNWDSLMGGTTGTSISTLWTGPAGGKGPGLEPQTTGALAGSPAKLTTTTLGADADGNHYVRSLTRMGITTVVQNIGTGYDIPGNAYQGVLTPIDGSTVLATVRNADNDNGTPTDTSDDITADDDAKGIVNQIYKITTGIIPPGNKLIVFGFGPKNDAIGDVMQETPYYPNTDPNQYYHRYLVIFEAHADGSRAELKMVTGADGDRIIEEIGDYYQKL